MQKTKKTKKNGKKEDKRKKEKGKKQNRNNKKKRESAKTQATCKYDRETQKKQIHSNPICTNPLKNFPNRSDDLIRFSIAKLKINFPKILHIKFLENFLM